MSQAAAVIDFAQSAYSGLSTDFSVILVIFLALFACAVYFGKRRAFALTLSFYLSGFLYSIFPYTEDFLVFSGGAGRIFLSKAFIWAVFALTGFFVLRGMVFSDFPPGKLRRWFESALLSAANSGLLLAFSFKFFGVSDAYQFAPAVGQFFVRPEFLFLWLIAPLLVIFFTSSR